MINENKLIQYISQFIDNESEQSKDDLTKIDNAFKFITLKKNDFFTRENEICQSFCFVESGILQHAIMIDEEEKTTYLALKNSVTTSLYSFINKSKSRKSIKAITKCELRTIDLNTFKNLIKTNSIFKQFYYNLLERQICLIDDYRIDLLTLTPEDRYKKMLQNEPKLLQEIPLHYLASFLGISTRNMSRIRKNVI